MTVYDNFAKFNTDYLTAQTNWFSGFTSFMPANFTFQMPSLFNWNFPPLPSFDLSSLDFSKIFQTNWDTQSINYNFNNNFGNVFSGYNFSTPEIGDTFTSTRRKSSTSLQLNLADKAKSYLGRVNSDAEGNRLFSNGVNQPWCADFVSHVTKETFGSRLPSSFKNFSSVSSLRQWGRNNGCYSEVPTSGKADFIAQNVKVGDIMIEKDGGKSHTGIVTKVNSDGSFETVEGNCGNKVATQHYTADSPTLSGFISLDRYTA